MKKSIFALAALAVALVACGGREAMAGEARAVVDANGQKVYGTEFALTIHKDTSSGNSVTILYASGNTKSVADTPAWAKYAQLKAGMDKPVDAPAAPGTPNGLVIDVAKVNTIECTALSQSVTSWPVNFNSLTLSDSCAFFNAAKAVAQ